MNGRAQSADQYLGVKMEYILRPLGLYINPIYATELDIFAKQLTLCEIYTDNSVVNL